MFPPIFLFIMTVTFNTCKVDKTHYTLLPVILEGSWVTDNDWKQHQVEQVMEIAKYSFLPTHEWMENFNSVVGKAPQNKSIICI